MPTTPAMHLPIYVAARKPQVRVTYTCPTEHWAGQKLRDFRAGAYDEIGAYDAHRTPIDAAGLEMLASLPPPNSAAMSASA